VEEEMKIQVITDSTSDMPEGLGIECALAGAVE